uniref:OJ1005_B10.1 protein n=1 Tax=Oryza sativa subsp. japonica TaxID=39947 RepID=Q7EZQ0_ORYSJ|nr:OJ1005_B10.1 [Oryza sativa Japonica Group]
MGHPCLRTGTARPDSWWAVPGREVQPIGRHGLARSAYRQPPRGGGGEGHREERRPASLGGRGREKRPEEVWTVPDDCSTDCRNLSTFFQLPLHLSRSSPRVAGQGPWPRVPHRAEHETCGLKPREVPGGEAAGGYFSMAGYSRGHRLGVTGRRSLLPNCREPRLATLRPCLHIATAAFDFGRTALDRNKFTYCPRSEEGAAGARSTASRSERRETSSMVDGTEVGAALPVVRRRRIWPPRGPVVADLASPRPGGGGSGLPEARRRWIRPPRAPELLSRPRPRAAAHSRVPPPTPELAAAFAAHSVEGEGVGRGREGCFLQP